MIPVTAAYPALLRLTLRCLTCHGGMGVLLGCFFFFFFFFFCSKGILGSFMGGLLATVFLFFFPPILKLVFFLQVNQVGSTVVH